MYTRGNPTMPLYTDMYGYHWDSLDPAIDTGYTLGVTVQEKAPSFLIWILIGLLALTLLEGSQDKSKD